MPSTVCRVALEGGATPRAGLVGGAATRRGAARSAAAARTLRAARPAVCCCHGERRKLAVRRACGGDGYYSPQSPTALYLRPRGRLG